MGRAAKYGKAMSVAERVREHRQRQRISANMANEHFRAVRRAADAYVQAIYEYAAAVAEHRAEYGDKVVTTWLGDNGTASGAFCKADIDALLEMSTDPWRARNAAEALVLGYDSIIEAMRAKLQLRS
jgi:hypothetical protein